MTNKTRTHITIQTRQTIVVRVSRNSFRAWCERCCDVVAAFTPESVTEVLQLQHSTLNGVLASGKWHVVEQGAKSPLLCANSLSTDSTENQILIEGESK